MFYAHFVLAKKGPLARIWLAAHWDKKLTKAHVYETNLETSVDGILQPKVKMALRTSGHLLLGVVRIYSRKAKYLLADCNEAFVKIKMAFRPGMVDLPEDKREAAVNAITLPDVFHDFDTMPDLDNVDIEAQFSMNQTRAEEITMREDYGNIQLQTGDDGFGDSLSMEEPEMLRDAGVLSPRLDTADELSTMGEVENVRENTDMLEPSFGDELVVQDKKKEHGNKDSIQLDAPIQDDGFGGVGLVQDILSGGLFEGGNLFDDADDDDGRYGDDLPQMPSPGSDNSRPPTPMETEPALPAPELDQTPAGLDQTPSAAAPAVDISSSSRQEEAAAQNDVPAQDQTTLLHNEDESFALAPVEASMVKGLTRTRRKRKLIVDEVKAISGDEMKAQLSDTTDLVTTLDIAPPTKKLMQWKESGGVDELFSLPGRPLKSSLIAKDYSRALAAKPAPAESEERVLDELPLEQIPGAQHHDKPETPKKRGPKRKHPDYAKKQEELVRMQEESAREERQARERLQQQEEWQQQQQQQDSFTPDHQQQQQVEPVPTLGFDSMGYATPGAVSAGYATPAQSVGCATPAHSVGFQTPVHQPFLDQQPPTPGQQLMSPAGGQQPGGQWGGGQQESPAAQPAVDNGAPANTSFEQNNDDDAGWDNDDFGGGDDDYGDDQEEDEDDYQAGIETEEGGAEMQEGETIEDFEDRVLNKRAAQLHKQLGKRLDSDSEIEFESLIVRHNTRKQVAQKFYSLLVLQKVMATEVAQSTDLPYAAISIRKGEKFATAAKSL